MTTTQWVRNAESSNAYDVGGLLMCSVASGSTIRRIRWSWGFAGTTDTIMSMNSLLANIQTAGLVTTIGNGTETPPNALTASGDAAPPTQRWLWWESRQPIPIAIDNAAGVISWRDSAVQEVPDVQTQVLATGIPGGDSLNLWFSWASFFGAWDATGRVILWVTTSTLVTTP